MAINIKISRGTSKWFAECKYLDVFATGDTPHEAMTEFERLCQHFRSHYANLPEDKCGTQARILKQRFEEFG